MSITRRSVDAAPIEPLEQPSERIVVAVHALDDRAGPPIVTLTLSRNPERTFAVIDVETP